MVHFTGEQLPEDELLGSSRCWPRVPQGRLTRLFRTSRARGSSASSAALRLHGVEPQLRSSSQPGWRCNPAFRTPQGWSLSEELASSPLSPDDEWQDNMESGKMAPPKNAPRDALVSAKDERRGMKLGAASVLGARPWRRASGRARVPASAQPGRPGGVGYVGALDPGARLPQPPQPR